jgi:hypothetical protein
MHTKDFCEKKVPKLLDFEEFFLKSLDLANRFQPVTKI